MGLTKTFEAQANLICMMVLPVGQQTLLWRRHITKVAMSDDSLVYESHIVKSLFRERIKLTIEAAMP